MANSPNDRDGPYAIWMEESRLLAECSVHTARRGGPGGQHRNKVSSAVVVCHEPSGVIGQASERRDQGQNRRVAILRLRINLALAVRHDGRLATGELSTPLPSWKKHIAHRRVIINRSNADFAALLAQLLDWLTSTEWQLEPIAEHLEVTPSQIVKFLKLEPAAWRLLNDRRYDLGLSALR